MDPRDLLRGFFGLPRDGGHRRRPWTEDDPHGVDPGERDQMRRDGGGGEEGQDEDRDREMRGGSARFDVMINPIEMERFFNQQLDEVLRRFGFGGGGPGFPGSPPGFGGSGGGVVPPSDDDDGVGAGVGRGPAWSFPFEGWGMFPPPFALPPQGHEQEERGWESSSAGSRNFMLKYEDDDDGGGGGRRRRKEDTDLDGLPPGRIGQVLDHEREAETLAERGGRPGEDRGTWTTGPIGPSRRGPSQSFFYYGSGSRSTTNTLPDGSVETTVTQWDSDGGERTTMRVTRPDGTSTLTTRERRRDGEEEDEDRRRRRGIGWDGVDMRTREEGLTKSLFDKFFGGGGGGGSV